MALARRAVTAFVAVPLAVSCLAAPDPLFGAFVAAVAARCICELNAMAGRRLPPRSAVVWWWRWLPPALAVVSVMGTMLVPAVVAGASGGQALAGDRILLLVFANGMGVLCGALLLVWDHQGAGSVAAAWFVVRGMQRQRFGPCGVGAPVRSLALPPPHTAPAYW